MSQIDIVHLAKLFEDVTENQTEEEPQEEFKQVIEAKEKDSFWDEDEITPIGFYKDVTDTRPEPKYVLHHKQIIGAEDVYLGLNMNDPSNSNIDSIVLRVILDDTDPNDIDLNVQNGYLDLKTPKYRLTLKLDKKTNDKMTSAKWDPEKFQLTIDIPVIKAGIKLI